MKKIYSLIIIFLALALTTNAQNPGIIEVGTTHSSLIFKVTKDQKVLFQYYGDKIYIPSEFLNKLNKNQPDVEQDFAQQIYPAFGGAYVQNPALRVTHADGLLTTELVYTGLQTKTIGDNQIETIISLKDNIYPLNVNLHYIAYQKENVICQYVEIKNNEGKAILIENAASFFLPLHAQSYYLTHYNGTWANEMQMEEEKLTHGVKKIESKKGVRTSQSESPSFLVSLNGPVQENTGQVYGGSLAWSGNFDLTFEQSETGILNILGGMNAFAATYHLKPNQVFTTPQMVFTYSAAGKGQITRNLHDWARKYGIAHGDQVRPVILNSWEGAYFSFNQQTLTDMMDKAADFGIEMFVLDDGWFGNKYPRNNDNAGLGDWQVNKTKLPDGIGFLADYAVKKGLKFGIWIEPEMVNPESELARKHPEWVVKSGKREILQMRNQWLLDLTNPKVQDFVFETFDNVVSQSSNISYIKWDANRHVENVGSEYLQADEQTHFWYDYVQGLYNVYNRIRAKYPNIEIQLCSSGSGRLDYGALKFHDEFWASDNTNPLSRVFIQDGINTFFPAIGTASHVSTSPNHQTGMMFPLKFRFDVAMSGRLGMELQPKDIVGDDYIFAKQAITNYKTIRPIVQFGDLYRLVSPYDENGWSSLMYVAKDKKQAVLFAYSLKVHNRSAYFEAVFNGLNPDKNYKVTELNTYGWKRALQNDSQVYSGDFLMKAGLNLNLYDPFDSTVLLITEE